MIHNMKLNRDEFYSVQDGLKDIEVRINDKKRKRLQLGDIIEFRNTEDVTEKAYVKVRAITKFDNFNQLYTYYPVERFGMNSLSREDLISRIYKIYTSSKFEGINFPSHKANQQENQMDKRVRWVFFIV